MLRDFTFFFTFHGTTQGQSREKGQESVCVYTVFQWCLCLQCLQQGSGELASSVSVCLSVRTGNCQGPHNTILHDMHCNSICITIYHDSVFFDLILWFYCDLMFQTYCSLYVCSRETRESMTKCVLFSHGNKSTENMLAHYFKKQDAGQAIRWKIQAFWRRYRWLALANAT